MDATFCYADLAGSVGVGAVGDDDAAAELVSRFTELAGEALGEHDRLVRVVGDAVEVACGDPDSAVVFVSTLFELLAGEPALQMARAGLHNGQLRSGGDPPPNTPLAPATRGERAASHRRAAVVPAGAEGVAALATQLALHARRGQALATVAVAEAASAAGVEITKLGDFALPGVREPVTIFDLDVRAAEGERVEDPVCRIEVERDRAPARLRYDSVAYYFCSLECAGDFARDPARYAFD